MIKSPCKDCTKKFMYCHSFCNDYKRFSQEREKIRQARNKEVPLHNFMFDEKYKNWKAREGTKRKITSY